ncbi:MAG: hypothetical protein SOZ27_08745 [Spirochaetia bacterium]|nr:hypothetical protein [Spirochaetia bacterium]
MKLNAEQIRFRFFDSCINAAILLGSALFSIAVGFLIAAPLWALATTAPVVYSRICFAGILLLCFLMWLRKMFFLKKKQGQSPLRKTVFAVCRTVSLLLAFCLILSVYWQFPISAVLCALFLILLRIPLFLAGDTL